MRDFESGTLSQRVSLRNLFFLTLIFSPFISAVTGYRDYLFIGWTVGLVIFVSMTAVYCVFPLHGKLVAFAFLYFALSALYVGSFEFNHFQHSASDVRTYFSLTSFYFLLSLLVFQGYEPQGFSMRLFPLLGCLNGLYTVTGSVLGFSKLSDGYGFSGILDYPSVNGVFTVTCYFLWMRGATSRVEKLSASLLVLLAIIVSKSSTPLGAFILGIVALNCTNLRRVAGAISASALLLGIGYYLDPELFNPQGRLEAWQIFMTVWAEKFSILFGSGPGTFSSLAIETQLLQNYMVGHYYLFMHNEWLQILYETGLVGLCFSVVIFTKALYNSYRRQDHYTVAALVSLGSASLLVFPLRYFWGAFLAVHCVTLGMRGCRDGRSKESGLECEREKTRG